MNRSVFNLLSFILVGVAALTLSACQTLSTGQAEPSAPQETGFLDRTVSVNGTTHRYQVYVPANYDPGQDWPLIMFLHGAGERGYEGLSQTHVGLGRAIRFNPERWPAIAVFPQIPPGRNWSPDTEPIGLRALEGAIGEFSVDTSRVYLTGLSMGGYGSLFLASRHPDRFTAVVAICPTIGGSNRYPFLNGNSYEEATQGTAEALSDLPVWLFHGEDDPVFPASISRDLTIALQEREADVRFTEYVETGHNAWDPAYDNTDMITWLFQQQKPTHDASSDSRALHH